MPIIEKKIKRIFCLNSENWLNFYKFIPKIEKRQGIMATLVR